MTGHSAEASEEWYFASLEALGGTAVVVDRTKKLLTYAPEISSDENHVKSVTPEELAHAVTIGLLAGAEYAYPLTSIGHEIYFAHGSKGSKADEVDILIRDPDGLPYAMFELKSAAQFDQGKDDALRFQLFGTAPLVGSPKLLVYATVMPTGSSPKIRMLCIDYTKFKTYDAWKAAGEPHSIVFPKDYRDLDHKPFVNQGKNDLNLTATQADFRAVALAFHNQFFGEHPDNAIFVNLLKCLLAKIYDERTCKKNEEYEFQLLHKNGNPETASAVSERVNSLYKSAYLRYIDSTPDNVDEINAKEFSQENVKSVVVALQAMSITKGAAMHGDIIGAFFEEILRIGFKQDRGMYFTHDNIVRFMVEAVDIEGLTKSVWKASNHPDNRLPYVMDPACGSGTFLLHAMNRITETVRKSKDALVADHDAEQFFAARLSDAQPNHWAESFIYGFDPKFIMAITAKINMVLHGDGSAHIFKDDAFAPFSTYHQHVRLRAAMDANRSLPRERYPFEVSEAFDLVISNPPFGITLSETTRQQIAKTFSLGTTVPSEGLFVERCAQFLKPKGRLALVLPESLLNSKELRDVRLILYRFFNIRAIVALPRNIFIDTPTLTSLLFAQKKTKAEIEAWDTANSSAAATFESQVKSAREAFKASNISAKPASELFDGFMQSLEGIVTEESWIMKSGKSPRLIRLSNCKAIDDGKEMAKQLKTFIGSPGFNTLREQFLLKTVCNKLDYRFPTVTVTDVGYKLSKRKERSRPNQLCVFQSKSASKKVHTNLHLAGEECQVVVDAKNPKNVLDLIRKNVKWE